MSRRLARDLGVGVAAGTISGIVANQIPQNQRSSRGKLKRIVGEDTIKKSPWAEVGRGAVLSTPKYHPAWLANSVVNHPGATATFAAGAGGAAGQAKTFDEHRTPKQKRNANVVAGASVGAATGLGADRATFYALKHEYKKKKYTAGQNGRSAKREIKAVKDAAQQAHPHSPRGQEHYKNANWPKHFKDAKLRRIAATRTGGKNAAVLAGVGAAVGTAAAIHHNKKVSKAMTVSAFGVDHGYEISKSKKNPQPPASVGRVVTGTMFPGIHGAIAGKKGSKLKAAGTEFGLGTAGMVAGALTHNARVAELGSYAGSAGGTAISQRKGWYKKQTR